MLEPFFKYASYPDDPYYAEHFDEYNIATDTSGPLYFVPSQCLKSSSF